MNGARTIPAAVNTTEKGQAPNPPQRRSNSTRCSRGGGGGRAAATFGAERAGGEGSPNGRTSEAKRCSARRRRTGHEEPKPALRHRLGVTEDNRRHRRSITSPKRESSPQKMAQPFAQQTEGRCQLFSSALTRRITSTCALGVCLSHMSTRRHIVDQPDIAAYRAAMPQRHPTQY